MDKQWQIEEITELARALCGRTLCGKKFNECISIGECEQSKKLAGEVYDRGYRKIPEGAVLIPPCYCVGHNDPRGDDGVDAIEDIRKQARKETAEKFAEKLKACYMPPINAWDEISIGILFCDIDEVCKELSEGK